MANPLKTATFDEAGSGTVLVLASVLLLFGLVSLINLEAVATRAEVTAIRSAQAAAQAATNALNGFETGFPCEAAAKVSQEDMAKLVSCRIVGSQVFIRTEVKTLGMVHFADARGFTPGVTDIREQ